MINQLSPLPLAPPPVELSFVIILRFFLRRKLLMGATFLAVFAASCIFLATREDSYLAQAVITVPPSDQGSSALSLPSAARSLLGSGGTDQPPEFVEFINSFDTMRLANKIAADPAVMRAAFHDQWDNRLKQWVPPESLSYKLRASIVNLFGGQGWRRPDAYDLRDYIDENVKFKASEAGDFQVVSFQNRDPVFAGIFLARLIDSMDKILRESKQKDFEQREAFLRKKIDAETNAVVVTTIYQLLSSVLASQVELEGKRNYAISFIDPVYVFPDPVSPRPTLVIVLSTVLGIVVALGIVFILGLTRFLNLALKTNPRDASL